MDTRFLVVFVLMDVVFVTAIVVYVLKKAPKDKAAEVLPELAQTLGLELHGGKSRFPNSKWLHFLRTPYNISGTRAGLEYNIFDYTVSNGKSSTTYFTIRIARPATYPLQFSISHENVLTKVAQVIGMQDLKTGSQAFDDKFLVRSKSTDFAELALLPEIQQALIDFDEQQKLRGVIRLDNHGLRYDEVGSFRTDKNHPKIIALVEVLTMLAQASDAYLEMTPKNGS